MSWLQTTVENCTNLYHHFAGPQKSQMVGMLSSNRSCVIKRLCCTLTASWFPPNYWQLAFGSQGFNIPLTLFNAKLAKTLFPALAVGLLCFTWPWLVSTSDVRRKKIEFEVWKFYHFFSAWHGSKLYLHVTTILFHINCTNLTDNCFNPLPLLQLPGKPPVFFLTEYT